MKIILITLLSFTSVVFAGEGVVGNGGNILVCSTTDLSEKSKKYNYFPVEVYEMFHRFRYRENNQIFLYSNQSLIKSVLEKIKIIKPSFHVKLLELIDHFHANHIFLSDTTAFSNDLESTIIPEDCRVKTIVFQRRFAPYYLISDEWHKLTLVSQEILTVHEAIYRYYLDLYPFKQSSFLVRKLTAYLFSYDFIETKSSKEMDNLLSLFESN